MTDGPHKLCEICHERPPTEGFQLCDQCKGFDPLSDSKEIPAAEQHLSAPITESVLELCGTCGGPIEPYQMGKGIRTTGECQNCYFKRRYGPTWKPGGMTQEEKTKKIQDYRAKIKKEADNGNKEKLKTEQVGIERPVLDIGQIIVHLDNIPPEITLTFPGDDQAVYERLMAGAKRERRTPDQHVLYSLERVVEV